MPALGEDEYYELTYWGMLPSDLKGGNVTTTNQIHVESTNSKGEKIDSDSSVNFNFNTVKKTGVKNDDDTISWTVTLNENHAEMKGWTLSDELNGSDYKGTVHFVTSTGASFDDALPYKFGTNSADTDTTASYTITYKTPGDHDYNTSQVKNKVTLKDDHDNEKGSSEYDVAVGSKDAYFKDGKGVIENTDGTLTLNWHIKLIIDKDYNAGWNGTIRHPVTTRSISRPSSVRICMPNSIVFSTVIIMRSATLMETKKLTTIPEPGIRLVSLEQSR